MERVAAGAGYLMMHGSNVRNKAELKNDQKRRALNCYTTSFEREKKGFDAFLFFLFFRQLEMDCALKQHSFTYDHSCVRFEKCSFAQYVGRNVCTSATCDDGLAEFY